MKSLVLMVIVQALFYSCALSPEKRAKSHKGLISLASGICANSKKNTKKVGEKGVSVIAFGRHTLEPKDIGSDAIFYRKCDYTTKTEKFVEGVENPKDRVEFLKAIMEYYNSPAFTTHREVSFKRTAGNYDYAATLDGYTVLLGDHASYLSFSFIANGSDDDDVYAVRIRGKIILKNDKIFLSKKILGGKEPEKHLNLSEEKKAKAISELSAIKSIYEREANRILARVKANNVAVNSTYMDMGGSNTFGSGIMNEYKSMLSNQGGSSSGVFRNTNYKSSSPSVGTRSGGITLSKKASTQTDYCTIERKVPSRETPGKFFNFSEGYPCKDLDKKVEAQKRIQARIDQHNAPLKTPKTPTFKTNCPPGPGSCEQ